MSFETWQAFFAMDGHGPYVWTAYGLAVLVLAFNIVVPWLAHRRFFDEQRRRQARLERHTREAQDSADGGARPVAREL
jgi:heme exporter protein D